MKKVAFLLVCVLYSVKCLIANPIPVAAAEVNEIMFDSEKGWILELYYYRIEELQLLKMTVSSSSGCAESKYLPAVGEEHQYEERFVLTRDSMKSELYINPLGDEITVIIEFLTVYWEDPQYTADVLKFGNYSGSQIKAPSEGQSIGYAKYDSYAAITYYAKTNEPTIGAPNDVSKMYGTLTGKVYDKNKQLVLNDSISFDLYTYPGYIHKYVDIDETGSYSIPVLANRLNRSHVYMTDKEIKITPFTIDIEPDSIMEQDIYLLEDYVGIAEAPVMSDFPIRIYPNPLSGGQALRYEVGTPVKSLDCRMELVAMDGRTMFESKITDHTGTINLPQSLSNGMYIVNFKLNNKIHYSTRLIIGQ